MESAPLEPYMNFITQGTDFHASIGYLCLADIEAMKAQNTRLGEQYRKLSDLIKGRFEDPIAYFSSRLLITYIADFEIFLQETISQVLEKDPLKLGKTEFKLSEILEAEDTSELIRRAAEERLNRLMYKKPSEYISDVFSLLSIEDAEIKNSWSTYVEAKARRDVGVHNGWKCNATYLRKVKEAGLEAKFELGDNLAPQHDEYFESVVEVLDFLSERITKRVLEKHWPDHLAILDQVSNH